MGPNSKNSSKIHTYTKMANIIEAKKEYMKELVGKISPVFYKYFRDIYTDISILADRGYEYADFQKKIRAISKWNEHMIDDTVKMLIAKINCDYLEDIIKITIVSNAKILMLEHHISEKEILNKADLRDDEDFIYKCLVECARQFYKNPMFFTTRVSAIELHNNYNKIIDLIDVSINNTIRAVLPIKDIVGNIFEVDIDEYSSAESEVSYSTSSQCQHTDVNNYISSHSDKPDIEYNNISDEELQHAEDDDMSIINQHSNVTFEIDKELPDVTDVTDVTSVPETVPMQSFDDPNIKQINISAEHVSVKGGQTKSSKNIITNADNNKMITETSSFKLFDECTDYVSD
jgi:hypothetical protein